MNPIDFIMSKVEKKCKKKADSYAKSAVELAFLRNSELNLPVDLRSNQHSVKNSYGHVA